jgi:hypothetical protein
VDGGGSSNEGYKGSGGGDGGGGCIAWPTPTYSCNWDVMGGDSSLLDGDENLSICSATPIAARANQWRHGYNGTFLTSR